MNLMINLLQHLKKGFKSKEKYSRREFLIKPVAIGLTVALITKNFSTTEMECHCGCGTHDMDSDFMKILQNIRDEIGVPLRITSGVRCSKHNQDVASSGPNGPHVPVDTGGRAVDIGIYGENALRLVSIAQKHGMTGLGIQQKIKPHRKRFIHLDNHIHNGQGKLMKGPRPYIWGY